MTRQEFGKLAAGCAMDSDRLAEIRARLEAIEEGKPIGLVWPLTGSVEKDIAYLLGEVEFLRAEAIRMAEGCASLKAEVERLIAEADSAYSKGMLQGADQILEQDEPMRAENARLRAALELIHRRADVEEYSANINYGGDSPNRVAWLSIVQQARAALAGKRE